MYIAVVRHTPCWHAAWATTRAPAGAQLPPASTAPEDKQELERANTEAQQEVLLIHAMRRFPYVKCFADKMHALEAEADACASGQAWDAAEISSCASGLCVRVRACTCVCACACMHVRACAACAPCRTPMDPIRNWRCPNGQWALKCRQETLPVCVHLRAQAWGR